MEPTSEQIIWCILKRIPNRTKKEEKILRTINKKQRVGREQGDSAEEYCMRQRWIVSEHHVDETGETFRSYHTIEVTESGRETVKVLWSASKLNPKNWWKKTIIWQIISAVLVFLTIVENLLLLILSK